MYSNWFVQCSWGSKPTPPGTASNPLPPPAQPYQVLPTAGMNQGYSPAELLAYQRQLALSQAAVSGLSGQALLQMTGQHGVAPASMGINSGGSQAMYDGYTGNSSRQQLMYYRWGIGRCKFTIALMHQHISLASPHHVLFKLGFLIEVLWLDINLKFYVLL